MTTDQTRDERTEVAGAENEPPAAESGELAPTEPQPAPFPAARGRAKGYDRAAVDAFMARARAAFEADATAPDGVTTDDGSAAEAIEPATDATSNDAEATAETASEGENTAVVESPFSSATVRAAAFPLARKGYLIPAVDGALARIEDAFAARERGRRLEAVGTAIWVADARRTAQEILDRLSRPAKHKFGRTGVLRFGYRVDEVDLVAGKLIRYFETGEPVSVEQVRQAAFRMQRAGYREEQVDALLDAVVEVMLAVR